MHKRFKWGYFFLIILLTMVAGNSFAQTTGKIKGTVADAVSGDPLPGANVMLMGTSMGAASDDNGDFFIINVPPGVYTVRVMMMGYQSTLFENVIVSVNRSSSIDAKLSLAVIEGQEVVVTADKVAIKKDQTSSIKNVSGGQISLLPVENVTQVIEMQAGVVGGHFRGGRSNEVSYLIDGMQVDEAFRGTQASVELEKEVVQDLEVITGTFNAEYGKAMSGIVNMITKNGSNKFHGSAYANLGNYVTSHDDIFIGLKPDEFDRIQDYRFQLEGPIWKDRISFITNLRYIKSKGFINGIYRFNPDDYSQFNTPIDVPYETPWDAYVRGSRYYSEHTGDDSYVPLMDYEHISYFGKISIKPMSGIRMSLSYSRNDKEEPLGFASDKTGADYGYLHSHKYNPYGMVRDHKESSMLSFQLNHLLSPSLFYDFKLSYNDNWFGRYLYEDPLDLNHVPNIYSQSVGGFSSGGTDKTYNEELSKQYIAKFDVTWQATTHHSLKSGFQYTKHRIENKPVWIRDIQYGKPEETESYYDEVTQKVIFKDWEPEIYPAEAIEMDQYVKKPYDYALYLQDKMEYDALVVNFGLRYDYFNSNTWYPSNRRNPDNRAYENIPNSASEPIDADPQIQLSPRLGLSYTLGQSAVLHFSYGHFFQMPPFYSLYTNHRFMVPTNDFGTEHGNPQINAQKTVKYEMGLWQELMPGLGLEVSVYYSDIYDLLTAVVWTTYNQTQYAVYDNKDYANVKGLELKLDWALGNIMTNFNYTLQYTRGNADNPRSTYDRLAQNEDPVPKLIPLSWDQRHTFSLNIGYNSKKYAISATGFLNSGFPYTIEPLSESRLAKQQLLPNNSTKPANYRIDLQGHYDVAMTESTKLRFFLYVRNLLDQLNDRHVYGSTGRAYTTVLGNVAEATFRSNYNTVYDQYENPGMYNPPREVKLGVGFIF